MTAARATSIVVGSPDIGVPTLTSWLPVERLRSHWPDLYRQARQAFWRQRYCAGERDIPFRFIFRAWWLVWSMSGRWSQRGRGPGKYQMARYGDAGAYEPSNVRIITFEENLAERSIQKMRDRAYERTPEHYAFTKTPEYRRQQSAIVTRVWARRRAEGAQP